MHDPGPGCARQPLLPGEKNFPASYSSSTKKFKALEAEREANEATVQRLKTERKSLMDEAARKINEGVFGLKVQREARSQRHT